jgi:hypothetical protein
MLDRGAVHIVVAAYIVDHYFLCFTLKQLTVNIMDHSSVKPQTVMVNNITSHNNMNHSSGPLLFDV